MIDLLLNYKNRKSVIQLFNFGLVGLANNLVGYLVYLLITSLGMEPKTAMSILYGVGAAISFIANRKFTFAHKGCLRWAAIKYLIAHSAGYSLNLVILIVFVDILGYGHRWVQAIAILVVALFLFIALKLFIFKEPRVSNGGYE